VKLEEILRRNANRRGWFYYAPMVVKDPRRMALRLWWAGFRSDLLWPLQRRRTSESTESRSTSREVVRVAAGMETAPESPRHWAADVPATGGWVQYEFHGSVADLEQWAAQRGVPAEQAEDEWRKAIDRIARRLTDVIVDEGMTPSVGIMSSAGW
jgi:hypothetical protein